MKTNLQFLFLSWLETIAVIFILIGGLSAQVTVNFFSNNTDFPILRENFIVEQNPFGVHLSNLNGNSESFIRLRVDIQGQGVRMTTKEFLQLQTFAIKEGGQKISYEF